MGRTGATPGAEGVCGGRGCGVAEEEASLETVVVEGPEVAEVVVVDAPLEGADDDAEIDVVTLTNEILT